MKRGGGIASPLLLRGCRHLWHLQVGEGGWVEGKYPESAETLVAAQVGVEHTIPVGTEEIAPVTVASEAATPASALDMTTMQSAADVSAAATADT